MSKSHSRHGQHVKSDNPQPSTLLAEGGTTPSAPASSSDDRAWGPGYRLALFVWLVGFFALLAWMIVDLLMGLFS